MTTLFLRLIYVAGPPIPAAGKRLNLEDEPPRACTSLLVEGVWVRASNAVADVLARSCRHWTKPGTLQCSPAPPMLCGGRWLCRFQGPKRMLDAMEDVGDAVPDC